MYRVIICIFMILVILPGTRAQDPVDFNTINLETYRFYLASEWDSVTIMGKQALKQGTDFYYLRIRMGIALYSQKNYRQASGHFKRALEFNEGDPVALEYLYYSRLFSGQYEQAGLIRKQFRGDLALKLVPPKGKVVDRIRGEYLFNKGLNDDLLSDPDQLFSELPPGVQYVTRRYSNVSLSLGNSITPGFRLEHAYSFLTKTNHFFYNDGLNRFNMQDQHVYQHQYYISPVLTTVSGFVFAPMFHLVSIRYQSPVSFETGFQGGSPRVVLEYTDELDYVTGLGFSKGAGQVDLYLGAWYATLNNREQVQNRLGITWYPLGNLNLYAGGYLNTQYEWSPAGNEVRLIPELQVGYAIGEKVWLDLNGSVGEMANYLEQNGSIVYNSFSDVNLKKVTLTVTLPVTEKGSLLYLGGRWTASESRFYAFDPSFDITNSITYNTLSIYGGISWKF